MFRKPISSPQKSTCPVIGIPLMSINEISSNRLPRLVTRRREQRERGRAVILTALMMVFTIPIVGLAIDAGLLYVVRGRLSADHVQQAGVDHQPNDRNREYHH